VSAACGWCLVGSTEVKRADFRLVCATHKNLEQMVEEGSFRQDLYYRINVFPIYLPPLTERLEDLPLLTRTLLQDGQGSGSKAYHLTESALARLREQRFRGNIRELRNVLSRATVLTNTNVIDLNVITEALDSGKVSQPTYSEPNLRELEIQYL